MSGYQEQPGEVHDLLVVEVLAGDLGGDQVTDEIVPWLSPPLQAVPQQISVHLTEGVLDALREGGQPDTGRGTDKTLSAQRRNRSRSTISRSSAMTVTGRGYASWPTRSNWSDREVSSSSSSVICAIRGANSATRLGVKDG